MRVLILGRGNVGTHLAKALKLADIPADLRSAREELPSVAGYDYVLISTKDDVIASVAFKLQKRLEDLPTRPIVAHTSGSVPMTTLTEILPANSHCGVFYPMQTFTKEVAMRYDDIPFLLEGSDSQTLQALKDLASHISRNIIEADSKVRAAYHIGAVLTCNFANHLCALAEDYLSAQNLDFQSLLPLLRQTISKLETTSPAKAQTGPALRHDQKVIDYHLSQLSASPSLSHIYSLLTDSIQKFHNS